MLGPHPGPMVAPRVFINAQLRFQPQPAALTAQLLKLAGPWAQQPEVLATASTATSSTKQQQGTPASAASQPQGQQEQAPQAQQQQQQHKQQPLPELPLEAYKQTKTARFMPKLVTLGELEECQRVGKTLAQAARTQQLKELEAQVGRGMLLALVFSNGGKRAFGGLGVLPCLMGAVHACMLQSSTEDARHSLGQCLIAPPPSRSGSLGMRSASSPSALHPFHMFRTRPQRPATAG